MIILVHKYTKKLTTTQNKKKWLKTFQFLAAYLVAAWTFLQFIDWILNRYSISPYWVDMLLWTFIGIIPSLLIYLFNQERINKRILKLREKILFPLNLIVLAIALFFGFNTSDLGATTKEIIYTNDTGELTEQVITKEEFRVGLPIFNFEQTDKKENYKWMAEIINNLLVLDLEQDKNVSPYTSHASTTTEKVSMTHIFEDFYIDGEFSFNDSVYSIIPSIHKSKNGKIISSKEFTGKNFFKLIDEMSIYIKDNVGILEEMRDNYIDLDVEEFVTSSLEALKHFHSENYEDAVKVDKSFALAYFEDAKRRIRQSSGKLFEREIVDKAYHSRYRLPKQKQLQVLIQRHIAYDQWEDAEELIKLQLEIDPLNTFYQELLYAVYAQSKNLDEHVKFAEANFENDRNVRTGVDLLNSMNLVGNYDETINVVNQYEMLFPSNDHIFPMKTKPLILKGDLNKAKENIRKTQLIHPNDKFMTQLFEQAVTFSEKSKNKNNLDIYNGEYRNENNEQLLSFFKEENALKFSLSNQDMHVLMPINNDVFGDADYNYGTAYKMKFLKDSLNNYYAVKYTTVRWDSDRNSHTYFWKYNEKIKQAENLLQQGDLNKAKELYSSLINAMPSHYFLKDALKHIEYKQSKDSTTYINKLKNITGNYGNRKFWVEDDKLFYKRSNLPRVILRPISDSLFINLSKYGTQMGFEKTKEGKLASYAKSYNGETNNWEKLTDTLNYLVKN